MSTEFRKGLNAALIANHEYWEDAGFDNFIKFGINRIRLNQDVIERLIPNSTMWMTITRFSSWHHDSYRPITKDGTPIDWESLGATESQPQRSYADMPTIEANMVDEVLVLTDHPRMPQGRRAVAIVLGLDTEQYTGFERFISGSRQSPSLRIGYGEDSHATELNALKKQLADAQAEVAKYRAAYDTNPKEGTTRASLLEID